jgi:hypothetical protein
MDAMLEQEKDAKLYELICKALLSDKDMKKVKPDNTKVILISCNSSNSYLISWQSLPLSAV